MSVQHNAKAERSLLGCIFLDNATAREVLALGVEARDFYSQAHRMIWRGMCALHERGDAVDVITLADHLQSAGTLEDCGGVHYLSGLSADVPSTAHADYYAHIVMRHAQRRNLCAVGERLRVEAAGEESTDFAAWRREMESDLMHAIAPRAGVSESVSMTDAVRSTMQELDARRQADASDYLVNPFSDLRKIVPYFAPKKLTLIAARPGMGKTALAMTLAMAFAREGKPVSFRSLEMPKEELALRCISIDARVDSHKIAALRLNEHEWARLLTAAKRVSELPIYIDDTAGQSPEQVIEGARRDIIKRGCKAVVVDYFQLMRFDADNARAHMGRAINALKDLAKETGAHVFVLSQLNRGVEARDNKRPRLADLKETSHLEEAADLVAFLYRDEMYNPDTQDVGTAEVLIGKHRGGSTGMARLAWVGAYTLFSDLAPDDVTGPGAAF